MLTGAGTGALMLTGAAAGARFTALAPCALSLASLRAPTPAASRSPLPIPSTATSRPLNGKVVLADALDATEHMCGPWARHVDPLCPSATLGSVSASSIASIIILLIIGPPSSSSPYPFSP
jgi:hypothetical protein